MTGNVNPVWHQLHNPGSVWIDDPDGAAVYVSPREVLTAREPGEVPPLLARIDQAMSEGLFAAGFFSYDSGSAQYPVPLVWIGIYDSPFYPEGLPDADTFILRAAETAGVKERFIRSVEAVRSLIESGIVYQVNYTDRLHFEFEGDPLALYLRLRQLQHGRYAAYVNTGPMQVLSFSPELFVQASPADGGAVHLETRPMKGTVSAGRGIDALRSEKNLSENYMIVDLMRNDLGRICKPGTVKVQAAGEVTTLSTALQMTSTVRGLLPPGPFFTRVWPALFPAGSITGAPRRTAMRTIENLEGPRGVYTGAVGHAGSGFARFNVAIRTLSLWPGRGEYGSGCGIVWESDAEEEYSEFRLKSSFLDSALADFRLIETMRCDGRFLRLLPHLRRLKKSAAAFAIPFSLRSILQSLARTGGQHVRVRLTLDPSGAAQIETSALPEKAVVRLALSDIRIDSGDLYRRHKTSRRAVYDEGFAAARARGMDDAVFLNERGEVVETSIRNILLRTPFGDWLTPPLGSGALPGVFLSELEKKHPRRIRRAVLFPEDLRQGQVFLCNSVRGLERARLDFLRADSPHPRVGG